MTSIPRILLVQSQPDQWRVAVDGLRNDHYDVTAVIGTEQAREAFNESYQLVVIRMPSERERGLELLSEFKAHSPTVPVVMITDDGDIDSAVEAMKRGAEECVTESMQPHELIDLLRQCLDPRLDDDQLQLLDRGIEEKVRFENIIGRSVSFLDALDSVRRAAETDCTILLIGESGTGKELVAEAIHQNSGRRQQPFVAVNIAAIPDTLVESELFGHVKGAFTGATAPRIGRFEAADGGTLFIDEIGDFKLDAQAKLLRALENRIICPVGGNCEVEVDTRVVAATNRSLDEMITEGTFREDLYYRLNVVQIRLPPLRERSDDIPILVNHFLEECCRTHGRPASSLSKPLLHYLERFDWPGNVRQLRNAIESMVIMADDRTLTLDDLPETIRASDKASSDGLQIPPGVTLEELERQAIYQTLEHHDGNRSRAADELGISVRTLQRRLKKDGEVEAS